MYDGQRKGKNESIIHPKPLKQVMLNSNAYVPTFWKGNVLLSGSYSGLLLEK